MTGAESRIDGMVTHSVNAAITFNPYFHFRLMTGRYETRCPAGRVYALTLLSDTGQMADAEAWLATRCNGDIAV